MDVLIYGQRVALGKALTSGSQGAVYLCPRRPDVVVKIYPAPTADLGERIIAMIAEPPWIPVNATYRFAWPEEPVTDLNGQIIGFLMPKAVDAVEVDELLNFGTLVPESFLYRVGLNLALSLESLHAAGHCQIDIHLRNEFAFRDGRTMKIDCDSIQFQTSQRVYRCPVGIDDFAPPELQGVRFDDADRTVEHDRHAFAVLLFNLLMAGTHPFDCQWKGTNRRPPRFERIRDGLWPYANKFAEVGPPRQGPSFYQLPTSLQDLFHATFDAGAANPKQRPTIAEWASTLQALDCGGSVEIPTRTWSQIIGKPPVAVATGPSPVQSPRVPRRIPRVATAAAVFAAFAVGVVSLDFQGQDGGLTAPSGDHHRPPRKEHLGASSPSFDWKRPSGAPPADTPLLWQEALRDQGDTI